MSRKRKWFWTVAGGASILLAVAYFVALPALVRNRVAAELSPAGFTHATFPLNSVRFFRSEMTDLKVSDDASLKRLIVTYTHFGVFSGTIRWLKVEGLELAVDYKDGRISISALDQFMSHARDPATRPATTK